MGAFVDLELQDLLGGSVSSVKRSAPVGSRVPVGAGTELAIAGDAYEGASFRNKELALWGPAIRSADQDIIPNKPLTDARTRDMLRNDAIVVNGANIHKDNIVGSLFMLNAKPSSIVLFGREDTKWEDEFQEEVETKFTLWAESPECWIDASRKQTLTGLTRLAVGILLARGEMLASVEWIRDWGGLRPFNTAIQFVDLDRLSTPPDQAGDLKVRGGVRMDQWGAPQGYYVRMSHPAEWRTAESYTWQYVPIRKPWGRVQMFHIFEAVREQQTRGMAQMVAALKEMRQTKNFREIVLQNAVVNATYAASIESELPTEAIFARLGGGEFNEKSFDTALNGYIGAWMNQVGSFVGGSKNLQIDGVKIPHLPPGSKLQLRPAGQGGPLGTEFEQSLLRYLAAVLDVSYEQLSKDYSKTNYSGFKGALNETGKAMASRKKAGADRFATGIYRLWFEEVFNAGGITSLPRRAPSLYEGQNMDAYTRCDWIGASSGQIDELKETQAAVLRINNGLSTLEKEAARLGLDWRQLLRQLAREREWKAYYDVLQNPTDTTNMVNASQGNKGVSGQ
jgi:lambda family phage portal protein